MKRLLPAPLALAALLAAAVGCAAGGARPEATPSEAAAPAQGPGRLAEIVARGELRVGLSGNQPPLNALARSGEIIGMEVDLARLLAGSLGVDVRFVARPFAELLPALRAGEVDLVLSGMTITPQRNLEVAFVGPYFVSGKSLLTKSQALAASDEARDIDRPGVTLAALEGSTSQRWIEVFAPKATLVAVAGYDEGVRMVRNGEVDALLADFPICVLSALRHADEGLVTLASPLTVEPIGIALPPDDFLFVNLVENYLTSLRSSGALEGLRQAWFERGEWLEQLP